MKKIYLSYSHHSSDNIDTIAFAKRITKDLEARGYKVWLDERNFDKEGNPEGVAEGTPFDIAMEEGIKDNDIILFLITSKAVTERSICRKEIIYGYNVKKETLPVRISDVVIPIFICDITPIDFHHGFDKDGELDKHQYKAILDQIDTAIQDFEKYKNSHSNKLQMHLLKTRYRPIVIDFVGRDWLFKECKEWIIEPNKNSRIAFLLGGPGTGKSAFLSVLTNDSELIKSVHFCSENENNSRKVTNLLLNWSYYLTTQDEDYKQIVEVLELENIKEQSPASIFRDLFLIPLKNNPRQLCFVADSLDEMEIGEGGRLVALLKQHISELPKNISFLVSSRGESDIIGSISNYKTFVLSEENNKEDTKKYINYMLQKKQISLTEVQKEKLLEASECNFQYLYYWFSEVTQNTIEEEQLQAFPQALEGILAKIMDRKFPPSDINFYRRVARPILSLLAVSLRPLLSEEIKMLTGLSEDDFNDFRAIMESLIPGSNDIFTFYHKSLREYLTNKEKASRFVVSPESGEKLMFDALRAGKDVLYLQEFGLVHAERSLTYPVLKSETIAYLNDLYKENSERIIKKLAATVDFLTFEELKSVSEYLNGIYNPEKPKDGKYLYLMDLIDSKKLYIAETILPFLFEKGTDFYYAFLGDMKYWSDDLVQAKDSYQMALNIRERNAIEFPSYQSRSDLGVSYDKFARLLTREDRLSEAKEYYQKSLKLAEQNVEVLPNYQSRRDLSISYNYLANIFSREDKLSEAKDYYQKSLKLAEENATEFPSYQSRRDLSISYDNFASTLLREDKLSEAKEYYQKSLEIAEQNVAQFPSYQSRGDLAVSYNNIAHVLVSQDKLSEAKEYYQKVIKIREQRIAEYPSYEKLEDLSLTYSYIAGILLREDKLSEAKEYYQKVIKISEQHAAEFPTYENRAFLSINYDNMADILKREDKFSEAREYYQKSLKLDEKNVREFPSFATRTDLYISYNNIVAILLREQKLKEAKEYNLKAIELAEQRAEERPSYQTRTDLCVNYNNVADILKREEKLTEAKEYYQKCIKIMEQNLVDFPNQESWIKLSVYYYKIAGIHHREDKPSEAKEYILAAIEIAENGIKDNNSDEGRAVLSTLYELIISIYSVENKGKKVLYYRSLLDKLNND